MATHFNTAKYPNQRAACGVTGNGNGKEYVRTRTLVTCKRCLNSHTTPKK